MEWFRTWLIGVMTAALVLSILYALLPKGSIRTIAQFTGGLILVLVILRPPLSLDVSNWQGEYHTYTSQINEQIAAYEKAHQEELRAIIEQETAAYISDKGSSLGIVCHPVVTAEEQDGIPYPAEVTLDIEWNEALSRYITEELDIPVQNQCWQGSD